MPDPFDPTSYEQAQPFDPQTLMQGPGQAAPTPPKQGFDKQKLLRLIPLVAAAAKGGPGAIEGLLSGYQQAEANRQRQATTDAASQRQAMLDQSLLQNRQFEQQRQVAEYRQKQEQARAELAVNFSKAVSAEDLTDPAALDLIVQAYEAQGRALGVRPGAFRDMAASAVKPDTLQRKAARKKINELRTQFSTKWMEEGAKFTHELPGGQRVSFPMLLSMAGMDADPNAPKAAQAEIATDVPLDRQHAAALVSGNEALAKQIEDAMRRQDAAKSQPADPQMAELNRQIAQLRIENLRSAVQTTGLPPRVQRQVDAQAKGFDAQPVTKRTQVMAEAVTFATGLDVNTKNPADDQALIYSFAKAMDPDSVVREGEYATVQKYAQSWAEQFGFSVARMFSNTPFLTAQARANMKATILAKYQAARGQYDNVRNEYARRISAITGDPDGAQYLIDYAGGFPGGSGRPTPGDNPFRRAK